MKKILLYSSHDTNYSYIGDLTAANKLQYCEAHGYDFFCKRKDFINAWHNLDIIKQENCYNLGLDHSEEKMFELVVKSLQEIYNI